MPSPPRSPRTSTLDVTPKRAVPGATVTVRVALASAESYPLPQVRIGGVDARLVFASPRAVRVVVPDDVPETPASVTVEGVAAAGTLHVGRVLATDLHQVDNPVFDRDGTLYVTDSGTRGQRVPVSVFKVRPDGTREPFVSGIVNATSMAVGPDGRLYVSSRFEGKVYRVDREGRAVAIGSDLGVACGLAFGPDGTLFVGDRSGAILRLDTASGAVETHATLPASVAAFHLAYGPDGCLYVTGPTLASRDSVYRVEAGGRTEAVTSEFGRPQGLCVRRGSLYVVEAAAGWNGVYRLPAAVRAPDEPPAPVRIDPLVAGTNLIGLAFDSGGGLVVVSNDTAYRFDAGFRL